jgi:hypothetical protein
LTLRIRSCQPEADFEVEAEASDTVANLKVKIYDSQGHDIAKQNILFCGRVLVDDRTLESYRISDKGFLVLMISRVKTTVAVLPDFVHLTSSLNIA